MWIKVDFEVTVYQYPDDIYRIMVRGNGVPIWPSTRVWLSDIELTPFTCRGKPFQIKGLIAARERAIEIANLLGLSEAEILWENA